MMLSNNFINFKADFTDSCRLTITAKPTFISCIGWSHVDIAKLTVDAFACALVVAIMVLRRRRLAVVAAVL